MMGLNIVVAEGIYEKFRKASYSEGENEWHFGITKRDFAKHTGQAVILFLGNTDYVIGVAETVSAGIQSR